MTGAPQGPRARYRCPPWRRRTPETGWLLARGQDRDLAVEAVDRAHRRLELVEAERLGDVGVRAVLIAGRDVRGGTRRSQYHDGDRLQILVGLDRGEGLP